MEFDTDTIPAGVTITIEANGDDGSFRIEARTPAGAWETAYWHADGTNDIMHGEIGTRAQAIHALAVFTIGEATE